MAARRQANKTGEKLAASIKTAETNRYSHYQALGFVILIKLTIDLVKLD